MRRSPSRTYAQPRLPGSAGQLTVVCPTLGTDAGLMVLAPVLGSIADTTFWCTVSLCQSHCPLVRSIASMMPSLPVVTNALRGSPFTVSSMSMRS